ncbi:sensor histidine kinase [Rhizobium sp. GCM10022189]|uniref:sensor histidine kinase n=1 Tax=Rhizobium sp. GCM10022189 TaxID=3252654 RepID=UPI00361B843D
MRFPNTSLWWRLNWQLSLLFVGTTASVIVGLCIYGAMILSPNVSMEHRLLNALEGSLRYEPGQGLRIEDSQKLAALKDDTPNLFFYAAAPDGTAVAYGNIPPAYVQLARFVPLIKDADIRGTEASTPVPASVDDIEINGTEIRVLYGGRNGNESIFLTMLGGTYKIYVPLLAVTLPALFFAVPRLVRRSLSGLSDVVRKAPEIDPRQPGSRLPVDRVPSEVVPLIHAFNSVLERLEQQFAARERFLIDAAHELRTPIAVMQTRIDTTLEGSARDTMMDDVGRLRETAEQLLDFERSEQSPEPFEQADLVEIARNVVADQAPIAIRNGYEISFDSDVEALYRLVSRSAMSRAISNLVRNAIDHGGNSGTISVRVSESGGISVSDEGPGIPAAHQDLVFEPFYRVAPRSSGAGLGLSIVKQIVTRHRGSVTLDGGPTGTTVTISL